MNSATELIDWYLSEVDILKSSASYYVFWGDSPCSCTAHKIIKDSSDSDRMQSFMLVGVLIDQMMWCHFSQTYEAFRVKFRYPKLYQHGGTGMANPDSLCQPPPRSLEGYGKNINWEKVSDVAQILLGDLYKWFAGEGKLDELVDFQIKLRQDVNSGFRSENAKRFTPIIDLVKESTQVNH